MNIVQVWSIRCQQEDDDHHNMHTTLHNSHANATKGKKKFQGKMEGFLEEIVSISSNLIASFHTITNLLKNMNAHMIDLVQKLQSFTHIIINIHSLVY